jgi:hypothetical protein
MAFEYWGLDDTWFFEQMLGLQLERVCEFDEGLRLVVLDDSQPGQFGSGRRESTVANVTAGVLYCCA